MRKIGMFFTLCLLLLTTSAWTDLGTVVVTVDPRDSEVYVDGHLKASKTPAIFQLPTGKHLFIIKKDGYQSAEFEDHVGKNTSIARKLSQAPPKGATAVSPTKKNEGVTSPPPTTITPGDTLAQHLPAIPTKKPDLTTSTEKISETPIKEPAQSTETTLSVNDYLHPKPPVRDVFQTDREFADSQKTFEKRRIELLQQFNKLAGKPESAAGKAELIKEEYDLNTGRFPVKITANDWAKEYLTLVFPHLNLPRDDAKSFYQSGPIRPIYLSFKDDGQIEERFLLGNGKKYPIESSAVEGEFVRITGGTFEMGCAAWQADCASDENPVHPVTLGDFELSRYEVTQGQWKAIIGANPSEFAACGDDCPVENVSWSDTQDYINKINARQPNCKYRLPTEAEWEYACRSGGKNERYCGGEAIDRLAWYSGNSGKKTHPVGQKEPNGLGLFDMNGNVWEWVSDWYGSTYYANSPKENPTGPSGGVTRSGRGGSRISGPPLLRSINRNDGDPNSRFGVIGFRLARECR